MKLGENPLLNMLGLYRSFLPKCRITKLIFLSQHLRNSRTSC